MAIPTPVIIYGPDGHPLPVNDDGYLQVAFTGDIDVGDVAVDFGTPVTGETLDTGGVGNLGWLSQVNKTAKAEATLIGATNETAPAGDTTAVGLNGRLQRIAQRLTTLIALYTASGLGALAVEMKNALDRTIDSITAYGSHTDDAAFTPATDKVTMVGFEYDDTSPDVLDEGDGGAARMSARREVYTQIRDALGNERGVAVTASNAIKTDSSATTQPVSGTVTASNAAGDVAHDAVDSGNPVKFGGKAATTTAPAAVSASGDRVNSTFDGQGRLLTRGGHQGLASDLFNIQHTPAVNTAATITQSAPSAGSRNVCTSIAATLASDAAPAAVKVSVSLITDTGGTPVTLWSAVLSIPAVAGASTGIVISNLWIVGGSAKDLRLVFSAAGGANTYESVSMTGVVVAE